MLIAHSRDNRRYRQENREWIDLAAEKYHERTGVYMTSSEAINELRELKRTCYFPPMRYFVRGEFEKRSNIRFICSELIRLIALEKPEYDPFKVIIELWNFLDDIGCDYADNNTWNFIRLAQDSIQTILGDIGTKEE